MRRVSKGRISGRCAIGKDSRGTGIHGAIWEDELLGEKSQHTAESSHLLFITIVL